MSDPAEVRVQARLLSDLKALGCHDIQTALSGETDTWTATYSRRCPRCRVEYEGRPVARGRTRAEALREALLYERHIDAQDEQLGTTCEEAG